MIIENGNSRLLELREDVEEFENMGIPAIQKLRGKLSSARNAMADLNSKLKGYMFRDEAEEIHFFKIVKPEFAAIYVYEQEIFKIETGKPLGDRALIIAYYEQELRYVRNFFDKHQFLYQYYLLDGHELDQAYFTRNGRTLFPIIDEPLDIDQESTTAGNYLFSKFIANEKIQDYLVTEIYTPVQEPIKKKPTTTEIEMKWTGDQANLIELSYGIWLTGQLNDGNASLNEIIRWVENNLSVKLGNFRKRFSEIENRKRLSSTKFLDQMKKATLTKMEEDKI